MTANQVAAAILVGSLAALAGCSSNGAPGGVADRDGNAMSRAGRETALAGTGNGGTGSAVEGKPSSAGIAGEGGTAGTEPSGTPCTTADDCDDAKPCDGQEACLDGFCALGEARHCDANLECSDSEGGACVFTDQSPWIIYQADDDTPGVSEIYAIKRGLLGKMTPIKLNDPLEAGWEAMSGGWSPDHQLYTFHLRQQSPYRVITEVVRFGHGLPERPVAIPGDSMRWAPSGRLVAMSEENGFSIYEYGTDGSFKLAFSSIDPNNQSGYGEWTPRDEFVFATTSKLSQETSIRFASIENTVWYERVLVGGIKDFWRFDLRPTGTELVYESQATAMGYSPMYIVELHSGNPPKQLIPTGEHSFNWSPDGSKFLLLENSEGYTRAFLGFGSPYTQKPTQIAPNELVSSARFTPDSQQVLLWEPSYEWAYDVKLLDPTKSTAYSYDMLARNSRGDYGPFFANDQDLAVIPDRADDNSEVHLTLFSLKGRHSTDRFDSIPPDSAYRGARISAHNEFVAYSKGVYPNYDGAYVDLRYNTGGDPKPVRLPGEGALLGYDFDPSGKAIYYIREQENGARDCYYLDLSRQVAQPPVKINRDGRTDRFSVQPLTP